MIGIYLSGIGNTEHCVRKLVRLLDESAQAIPMEKKETVHFYHSMTLSFLHILFSFQTFLSW